MKLNCNIIRDLLPLYSDKVCSEESRDAVEEHLKECEACREELKAISDDKPVSLLKYEGDALIIGKYRRIQLNRLVFFLVCALIMPLFNGIFASLLGCAVSESVIVTVGSMLAFVFIPAVARKKRFVWIAVSSVLACAAEMWLMGTYGMLWEHFTRTAEYGNYVLMILLLPSAAFILFAAVMLFWGIRGEPLDPFKYRAAALKLTVTETFCLFYIGYVSTLTNMESEGPEDLIAVSVFTILPALFLWLAFLVFKLCKKNILIRLSLYSAILGVLLSVLKPNYCLEILTISFIVAAAFLALGVFWGKKR